MKYDNSWQETDQDLAIWVEKTAELYNLSVNYFIETVIYHTNSKINQVSLLEELKRLKKLTTEELIKELSKPKILEEEEWKGYYYAIAQNRMGCRCGYIGIPSDHPWFEKPYEELEEVRVHGGLTFSDYYYWQADREKMKKSWWIGFDCAHAFDAPDPMLKTLTPLPCIGPGSIAIQCYVRKQCFWLIEQAIAEKNKQDKIKNSKK